MGREGIKDEQRASGLNAKTRSREGSERGLISGLALGSRYEEGGRKKAARSAGRATPRHLASPPCTPWPSVFNPSFFPPPSPQLPTADSPLPFHHRLTQSTPSLYTLAAPHNPARKPRFPDEVSLCTARFPTDPIAGPLGNVIGKRSPTPFTSEIPPFPDSPPPITPFPARFTLGIPIGQTCFAAVPTYTAIGKRSSDNTNRPALPIPATVYGETTDHRRMRGKRITARTATQQLQEPASHPVCAVDGRPPLGGAFLLLNQCVEITLNFWC